MIATVHMPTVMMEMTLEVRVTGKRQQAIRTRIGVHLLALAARVIGCDLAVSFGADDAQESCAYERNHVAIKQDPVAGGVC